jgi:hypothetical protein
MNVEEGLPERLGHEVDRVLLGRRTSLVVAVAAIISDSVVEVATRACCLLLQETTPLAMRGLVPESRAGVALVWTSSSVYLASCTSAYPSTQSSPSLTTSVMVILIALSSSAAAITEALYRRFGLLPASSQIVTPSLRATSGRRSRRRTPSPSEPNRAYILARLYPQSAVEGPVRRLVIIVLRQRRR